MREIKFKAKTCNGEWVEGLLAHKDDKWYISNKAGMPFAFEVRPETICQYTGLTDKNGNKIWEGDAVRVFSTDYMGFDEIGKVEYKDGCFGVSYFPLWERELSSGGWHFHRIGQVDKWKDMCASGEMKYTYEVIGNKFDNPELCEEV